MTQTDQQLASTTIILQTTTTNDEGNKELNEYLKKLIQLVPYLKNIENEKSLLQQKLENFQYLSINNEALNSTSQTSSNKNTSTDTNENGLSDLQILQSALDYIFDLQEEIYLSDNIKN
jgi:hypothetical protein